MLLRKTSLSLRHDLSARLRAKLHRQGLFCYSTDVEDTSSIVVPHDEDLTHLILYEEHKDLVMW